MYKKNVYNNFDAMYMYLNYPFEKANVLKLNENFKLQNNVTMMQIWLKQGTDIYFF